ETFTSLNEFHEGPMRIAVLVFVGAELEVERADAVGSGLQQIGDERQCGGVLSVDANSATQNHLHPPRVRSRVTDDAGGVEPGGGSLLAGLERQSVRLEGYGVGATQVGPAVGEPQLAANLVDPAGAHRV